MAFQVHVARIAFLMVDAGGNVVDKDKVPISKVLNTESKHVILPDSTNHNTNGYPTVDQYIKREAEVNFVVHWLDQNTVITYQHSALS